MTDEYTDIISDGGMDPSNELAIAYRIGNHVQRKLDEALLRQALELLMIGLYYAPEHQQRRTDLCNELIERLK